MILYPDWMYSRHAQTTDVSLALNREQKEILAFQNPLSDLKKCGYVVVSEITTNCSKWIGEDS